MQIDEKSELSETRSFDSLFELIKVNLIRAPKVQVSQADGRSFAVEAFDPRNQLEEEEIMLEESWPHIHLVYECLLRAVLNPYFNVKMLKEYIDEKFLR